MIALSSLVPPTIWRGNCLPRLGLFHPWGQLAGLQALVFSVHHSGDSGPLRGRNIFSASYKFSAEINPPVSLHQRRLHDGDATANPRPDPGGDPGPLQRRAADARHHGGLYHYAEKDLQVCVCLRPGKVRGVDGRVWLCVGRIHLGGPKRAKTCWKP